MSVSSEHFELVQTFVEEAKDIIERVRVALEGVLTSSDRGAKLNEVFRGIHTIKGGSGVCELVEIKDIAHELESKLVEFKKNPDQLNSIDVRMIELATDNIERLLESGAKSEPQPTDQSGLHLFDETAEKSELTGSNLAKPPSPEPAKQSDQKPKESKPQASSNPPELIRVSLDRVQKNFDVISEIFLTRNQMRYLIERLAMDQVARSVDRLIIVELPEQVILGIQASRVQKILVEEASLNDQATLNIGDTPVSYLSHKRLQNLVSGLVETSRVSHGGEGRAHAG